MDRRKFLKVKIRHLAEESKIIKHMKGKEKDIELKQALNEHRVHVVRRAARNTQLAYAFLRRKRYDTVERKGVRKGGKILWHKDLQEILRMAQKYSPADWTPTEEEVKQWLKG